jgi:DNA-binding NarL/FixJ family response regulator
MSPREKRTAQTVMHRVLIVDDFEPWRRHLSTELGKNPRWHVVGEAADGREAVVAAQALAPDLILLDIGLPTMNGLEAARRILAHRPESRILFLTEQHSLDIVEAGLELGARGYLFKMDAGRDLLPAMESVVNGGRFVSAGVRGRVADPPRDGPRHEVRFYSDESAMLDDYTRFAEEILASGYPFILVAPEARRNEVERRLRAGGLDLDRLIAGGTYLSVDPTGILSAITRDGWPDPARFRDTVGPVIVSAGTTSGRRVTACGECAPGLWHQGKREAATCLERLWDELANECDFDTLCMYLLDAPKLADDDYAHFQQICATHSYVGVT